MPRRLLLLILFWPVRLHAEGLDIPALMTRLAAVPERRARFREEKRIAALTVPLVSTGTLLYRRPGYLEKTGEGEQLVVDGDRVTLTLGQDPPRVIPLSADPGLRALIDAFRAPLAGDLPTLTRSFQVTGEGTAAAWRLTLLPANAAVARFTRSVTVSGVQDRLQGITIVQFNGDVQTIDIEGLP